MTVLYKNEKLVTTEVPTSPFDKFFARLYKVKFLVPIFPNWTQDSEKYWYKESFLMVIIFSSFFYLLSLFFVFLAVTDREHLMDFLLVALGWLAVGLIIPSAIYRLTLIILRRQKIID